MTNNTESDTTVPEAAAPTDIHRRGLLAIGTAAALGTAVGPGIATAAEQHDDDDGEHDGLFLAALTGDQQPEPVDTDATGGAVFSVSEDGSELEYAVLVTAIEDVNQAHIHIGSAGEEGPIAVWLYPGPDDTEPELEEGRFDGVLATDTITEENLTEEVEGQSMDALLEEISEGNAYVNAHTEEYPAGEIRGQLTSAADAISMLMDDEETEDDDGEDESVEDDGDDESDNVSAEDDDGDNVSAEDDDSDNVSAEDDDGDNVSAEDDNGDGDNESSGGDYGG